MVVVVVVVAVVVVVTVVLGVVMVVVVVVLVVFFVVVRVVLLSVVVIVVIVAGWCSRGNAVVAVVALHEQTANGSGVLWQRVLLLCQTGTPLLGHLQNQLLLCLRNSLWRTRRPCRLSAR